MEQGLGAEIVEDFKVVRPGKGTVLRSRFEGDEGSWIRRVYLV